MARLESSMVHYFAEQKHRALQRRLAKCTPAGRFQAGGAAP
jgi:hypothetical protein